MEINFICKSFDDFFDGFILNKGVFLVGVKNGSICFYWPGVGSGETILVGFSGAITHRLKKKPPFLVVLALLKSFQCLCWLFLIQLYLMTMK